MFEHDAMARMRAAHPDWIWNRSDTHAFVAVPGSHESFKTVVEPGNSLSPGPGTYGVSTWLRVGDVLHAPEEMPLEDLRWRWAEGGLPVLVAEWRAGDLQVTSRLFADGDVARWDVTDYLCIQVANVGAAAAQATLYLVLRSFGASGGPVTSLAMRDGAVLVNGAAAVYPEEPPGRFGAVSYEATGEDISVVLRRGDFPADESVEDASGWASGALEYPVSLGPGKTCAFDFAFRLHPGAWTLSWRRPPRPVAYGLAEWRFLNRWREALPPKLEVPDARVADAFHAIASQLLMFTVGDAPRISPVTYPLWWMRDCSYIVVALDRAGQHDFAGRACRDAVRVDAMTGFGGEADVPGEAIWMLSEHYLLTRDLGFLGDVFPFVRRKADLLVRARHTTEPIRVPYEFIVHEHGLRPDSDLFCAPARDGLIQGRMDHHYPLFWVNGFAYLGLRRAALCARALGEDGAAWDAEADDLRLVLMSEVNDLQAPFGTNERDVVSALWPCGWADPGNADLRGRFDNWWQAVRCPGGVHRPERLWTYFEVGEAHNYLLLGHRERAWTILDHFLDHHSASGLCGWPEGERDENSALLLWQRTRGWDRARFVTPNSWTSAEMLLLLRDCLVREDGDALVLGSGVPEGWMGEAFSARDLPTHFGRVSLDHDPARATVTVAVETEPPGGIRAGFPAPVEVRRRPG
jgi:hypothetical protein